ncbi:fungal transcriptional regulatory protein [Niveomyces insectorum RCEF 264]|uniref:Fungal transcriptional regulatory protein n=1 Tax=Niveomyces insectorum RCEF 264 TaxID=1081102 RepID=A0A162JFX5_9HYPO|nr:fungal transcriptional regulatory protein [Niveomyces insectorum RCEF 264]
MPPPDNVASPAEKSIQSLPAAASSSSSASSSLRIAKMRQASLSRAGGNDERPLRPLPLSQSEASLPLRRSTPTGAAASLYASTLTPPGSRSISPVGRAGSPASRTMSLTSITSTGTAGSARTTTTTTSSTTATTTTAPPPPLPPPGVAFTRSLLERPAADQPGDPLHLLLNAFVPHVAVYSSRDTDELVREKGFAHGLWELLRPFGERVHGRVQVRDSNGAARARDDFAVRFVPFGAHIEVPEPVQGVIQPPTSPPLPLVVKNGRLRRVSNTTAAVDRDGPRIHRAAHAAAAASFTATSNAAAARIPLVEAIVDKHLRFAESSFLGLPQLPTPLSPLQPHTPAAATQQQHQNFAVENSTSPYYALYLRRMLSGIPVACHETFAHPVACVIAISSRNPAPIQTFQELYRDISQGDRRLPPWVDGDFLRYYVLVHDEENGDIVQSMALFEKMKRSLGLHCHLLRLRSSQSAETDDDSIELPRSDWMTAVEEYADLERGERLDEENEEKDENGGDEDDNDDDDDLAEAFRQHTIFESDATAIRTFVREMVIQSIVPTMERSVSLWNDQVASKRKGLSGRFMSLSKRWTSGGGAGGFGAVVGGGGGGGGGSNGFGGSSNSGSNYDAQRGFYRAETHEAILRKLADYAFMLRDWKLAMSTYDILRTDFANDKAWKYHAAANEMCALSLLIMPPSQSSRTKLDTIHSLLEQAFYSYLTRCGSAYGAVRSIGLGLELQRLRGGPAVDEAVRWGMRLLEARLVGAVGDALLRERMAVACGTRAGLGSLAVGTWRRKSAFWSVLAAEAWVGQGQYIQAQRCLNEARRTYSLLESDDGVSGFAHARDFMAGLQQRLKLGLAVPRPADGIAPGGDDLITDMAAVDTSGDNAAGTGPAVGGATADEAGAAAEGAEQVELLADDATEKLARRRSRRDSLLRGSGAGQAGLETAPLRRLSPAAEGDDANNQRAIPDNGFGQV